MTRETARKVVLGTFFLVLAFITFDELHNGNRVPNPARYIGALVAWFILGIFVEVEPALGAGLAGVATLGMAVSKGGIFNNLPGVPSVSISSNGKAPANQLQAIRKGHP